MRPSCFAASVTMAVAAFWSATSATAAMALPPSRSMSRTTCSASLLFERTLIMMAAPPEASAFAIARPMLRPAPVTSATRPDSSCSLTPQLLQIDAAIIERSCDRQRPHRTRVIPTAVPAIERELLEDILTRERFLRAATKMRLAFLDQAAVGQPRADVADEFIRIGILRIDAVAHLRRHREHAFILHGRIGEIAKPHIAAHQRRRDAIRLREFSR